jgi:hypothetical protein
MGKMQQFKRAAYGFTAFVLGFYGLFQVFAPSKASAALLSPRLIRMSSSAQGAAATTYHVEFRFGQTGNVGGIVVDFCDNSPIIGDTTCTNPTGFSSGTTVTAQSNGAGADISTFTTVTAEGNGVSISNATPVNMTATNVDVSFDITNVTNPTTANHTFYARIYTFATQAAAQAYTIATPGTYLDAGGIALSTAEQITITSRVQERLVFCVYTSGAGDNCTGGDETGNAIILGDTNGVLDPTGPYVNKDAKFSITTNAQSNAVVNVKGTTLTSGGNTIDANATATASNAGTEQFGLCVYQSAGSGMTIDTLYDGDLAGNTSTDCTGTTDTAGTGTPGGNNNSEFAFDTASTTGTYGDTIVTKPAGNYSTGTFAFIGNIANTTEAGIYTTVLTFIATGSY